MKALAELTEDQWDAILFRNRDSLAKELGWTSYHTLRSRGSKAGYPDRTLCRDRIIFAELKRVGNKPTDDQVAWLDKLARAGGEVYLWLPTDVDEVGQILGRRWTFHPSVVGAEGIQRPFLSMGDSGLVPRSAWVPGFGRIEQGTNDVVLDPPQLELT